MVNLLVFCMCNQISQFDVVNLSRSNSQCTCVPLRLSVLRFVVTTQTTSPTQTKHSICARVSACSLASVRLFVCFCQNASHRYCSGDGDGGGGHFSWLGCIAIPLCKCPASEARAVGSRGRGVDADVAAAAVDAVRQHAEDPAVLEQGSCVSLKPRTVLTDILNPKTDRH